MRKVHYKVTLDIFTHEYDNANGVKAVTKFAAEATEQMGECFGNIGTRKRAVDVQDVQVLNIEVTDSR